MPVTIEVGGDITLPVNLDILSTHDGEDLEVQVSGAGGPIVFALARTASGSSSTPTEAIVEVGSDDGSILIPEDRFRGMPDGVSLFYFVWAFPSSSAPRVVAKGQVYRIPAVRPSLRPPFGTTPAPSNTLLFGGQAVTFSGDPVTFTPA